MSGLQCFRIILPHRPVIINELILPIRGSWKTPKIRRLQVRITPRTKLSGVLYLKLEALREGRPPWLRQIITPILATVKMLSLGGKRLTPHKKKKKKEKKFCIITSITIWVCYPIIVVFLLIYSS